MVEVYSVEQWPMFGAVTRLFEDVGWNVRAPCDLPCLRSSLYFGSSPSRPAELFDVLRS